MRNVLIARLGLFGAIISTCLGAAVVLKEDSIWNVEVEQSADGKFQVKGSVFAIGDPVHETLTLQALLNGGLVQSAVQRNDPQAVQIIRGVFWNDDPCAQLFAEDDFAPLKPSFGVAWYLDFSNAKQLGVQQTDFRTLSCRLLGRSHFGDMQFLHAMANANGVRAIDTGEQVMAWASVTYRVSIGSIDPRLPLTKEPEAKKLPAAISDSTPMSLMRAKTEPETRLRALGALLHTIQDSYAHGHVSRVDAGGGQRQSIEQFLCYTGENPRKHAHDDAWGSGSSDLEKTLNIPGASDALAASTQIVKLYLANADWPEVMAYLMSGPLLIKDDAKPSGPGAYQ